MIGSIRLVKKEDEIYDIVIEYDKQDTEFANELFSKEKFINSYRNISEFIEKHAKNIKIASIKIIVSGVIIATIPFISVFGIENQKYSMTYLYGGTVQQQISYVQNTNNSIQTVCPSYFDINNDGSLKLNLISQELITYMHNNKIRVVPFLSNHWNRTAGINALNNIDSLSTQIAQYVYQYNLDGINVDIENVTELQRSQYTEFVKLLRQKIPTTKEVSVAVAANPNNWQIGWQGSYDYTGLAQNSNYLMMMTYDEHYEGGTAGPVASIEFIEKSINYSLSKTTSDKIVMGIPFYGRIWSTDNTNIMGKGIPINLINNIIADYNAIVTFDSVTQSQKAEFEIKSGDKQYTVGGQILAPGKYIIWYENNDSIKAKLNLIQKYNLKGVGSWALGQEDISIWNNYNEWLNGEQILIPSEYIIYTVQSGDTLWLISQKFGTTVDSIKTINNLTSDNIYIDQQLKIPATTVIETITKITNRKVSVRATPSSSGKTLITLNKNTKVTVLGSSGEYTQVSYNGSIGYINTRYLN